ncbi:MAG: DUF4276 family protein [Deltaproteobacteria bacterium]|nr:DUF4276 family protein [Deltaproteobacteria bacterium]MBI2364993.1 DUF4276 family protein [Deltaproteobacteria bacterium]MBI2532603.1 DUF4276 family protein [Deltaproteobacteria bacterium]
MSSPLTVDLFAEDRAHEEFLRAMLNRISDEQERYLTVRVRSARGGHPRVLEELSLYQKSVLKAPESLSMPDLLFIAIDANCKRWNRARRDIQGTIQSQFAARAIVACPDPHIERWYLADPDSFAQVVGVRPKVGKRKCERDRYKAILSKAIVDAGHPATLGGIEFARELVAAMDLYRAGKAEGSLKHFLDETIARVKTL